MPQRWRLLKNTWKHIFFKTFITNILETDIYVIYLQVVPSMNNYFNQFLIINAMILILKTCEEHWAHYVDFSAI